MATHAKKICILTINMTSVKNVYAYTIACIGHAQRSSDLEYDWLTYEVVAEASYTFHGKTFQDLLQGIIELRPTNKIRQVPRELFILSLFTQNLLSRFSELIGSKISNVQGSAVTTKSIKIQIRDAKKSNEVLVDVRDAILLCPELACMPDDLPSKSPRIISDTIASIMLDFQKHGFSAEKLMPLRAKKIPITLAKLAETVARHRLKSAGLLDQVDCEDRFDLVADSYLGGRFEHFAYGKLPQSQWFDYDLPSAYVTALAGLPLPIYETFRANRSDLTRANAEVLYNELGSYSYAWVKLRFQFSKNVPYPCIAVKYRDAGTNYLLFPRTCHCDTWVPIQSFRLAVELGANLTVLQVASMEANESIHPYRDILREICSARASSGELMNSVYKALGNTLYGKIAQNVSLQNGEKPKHKAHLTNRYFASLITDEIRSLITRCMLYSNRKKYFVSHCATDGFCCNGEIDQSDMLKSIPQLSRMHGISKYILGDNSIQPLVVKGHVQQLLISRAEYHWTLVGNYGSEIIHSGGQRLVFGKDKSDRNRGSIQLLRKGESMTVQRFLSWGEIRSMHKNHKTISTTTSYELRYKMSNHPNRFLDNPNIDPMAEVSITIPWTEPASMTRYLQNNQDRLASQNYQQKKD